MEKKFHSIQNKMVLIDETVYELWKEPLQPFLQIPFLVIPSGEVHKNLEIVQKIWNFLFENHADRNTIVLNIGGGVIGDMGGFAASVYKRGISFIQVPTTLLAMVDASIGGKTGIDYSNVKNIIGSFSNPHQVWILTDFLQTLPDRHLVSGKAEMLKHALLKKPKHLNSLECIDDEAIFDSVKIKYHFIKKDLKERNLRKALNLGHTIGHALESYALVSEKSLLHGEAVIYGIHAESFLAKEKGMLSPDDYKKVDEILRKLEMGIDFRLDSVDFAFIKQFIEHDKKKFQQSIVMPMLTEIGDFELIPVNADEVFESFCKFVTVEVD